VVGWVHRSPLQVLRGREVERCIKGSCKIMNLETLS
jgi:hypothetical protein